MPKRGPLDRFGIEVQSTKGSIVLFEIQPDFLGCAELCHIAYER